MTGSAVTFETALGGAGTKAGVPAAAERPPKASRRVAGPAVWESTADFTRSALQDMAAALRRWPLWVRLGWQDVMLRYRRSMLGPLWLTLSMGVMVTTLGVIYGDILKAEKTNYVPFLTTGFLVWGLISSSVSEGCQTFIESDWLIRQLDLPLAMFPLRVVWRNVIVFLHNAIIYLVMLMIYPVHLGWVTLEAIPGFLAILINALWCAALLGMVSARFRDLPQIVSSLMQVAFFATPIIWPSELARHTGLLVAGNPFYHLIEVVRAPLLGLPIPRLSWLVVGATTAVGWAATLVAYRRFHRRISYWV